ncbi:hypothetical protein AB0N09_34485 [Streptomyces erythrochromogenes]|uniref:hypothetical protein n=1 Tax=Streptomyces erythrochromogenes TaxID=285574 RepID=UPI00342FCA14
MEHPDVDANPYLPTETWEEIGQYLPPDDRDRLAHTDRRLRTQFHDPAYLAPGWIRVHTQGELDEALSTPGLAVILLEGPGLTVNRPPLEQHCKVVAKNDVTVGGNGRVHTRDSVHVTALNQAVVHAEGNATVTAYTEAQVHAYNETQVVAHDKVRVTAQGNAYVTAYHVAYVNAAGNTHVEAYANTRVDATGTAHVRAYARARVLSADEHARIAATDDTTVIGRADTVRIWATASVTVDALPATALTVDSDPTAFDWTVLDAVWEEFQVYGQHS